MKEKLYLVLEKEGYKLCYPCENIEKLKNERKNEKLIDLFGQMFVLIKDNKILDNSTNECLNFWYKYEKEIDEKTPNDLVEEIHLL